MLTKRADRQSRKASAPRGGRGAWALLLAGTLGLAAAALPAAAPRAQTPTAVDLTYDVYTGGLLSMTAKVGAVLVGERYDTRVEVELAGLPSLFADFSLEAEGLGAADTQAPRPERFTAESRDKKDRLRRVAIEYLSGGVAAAEAVPSPAEEGREGVEASLRVGALDPIAAGFMLLRRVEESGRCDGRLAIYDGRRLYGLQMQGAGRQQLSEFGSGMFAGEALACRIEVTPLAGFQPHEVRKKKYPHDVTVWLARPDGLDRLVPVRLDINKLRFHMVEFATREVQQAELPE